MTTFSNHRRLSNQTDNANGSVQLTDVASDAKVRTSFGSVFVKGVGGSVDVQNQNGAIGVTGMIAGGCKPVSLRTSFSSMTSSSDKRWWARSATAPAAWS